MNKIIINVNDWSSCLYAYLLKKKNPDIEVETTEETIVSPLTKEDLKNEDGSYPELALILFDMLDTPMRQYLLEGINLAEFNPLTPGGQMFWEHMINSEDLTKKALEEGQAIGKWDTLRQIMNMGQIAYMAKINAVLSYMKMKKDEASKDEVLLFFEEYYWDNAVALLTEEK